MKKLLYSAVFLSLLGFSSYSYSSEILSEHQMDSVVAGTSNYAGKYSGTITGDDTGKFKLVVKNSGIVNGHVKFNDGGKTIVKGSVGNDGIFGASLLGQRKNWGIGGFWGSFTSKSVSGNWSRPNNKSGNFSGNRK